MREQTVRKAIQAFSALALLLSCLQVRAQSTNADVDAKARIKQLYDEGLTNYNLGHYEDALVSFDKAYRIRHDSTFLFNIGQCERNLHRYEDAERSYRAYLRETSNIPPDTRDKIQKLVSEMEKAVADQRAKQPPTGIQPSGSTDAAQSVNGDGTPRPQGNDSNGAGSRRHWYRSPTGWTLVSAGVATVVIGGLLVWHSNSLSSQPFDSLQQQQDLRASSSAYQVAGITLLSVGAASTVAGGTVLGIEFRRETRSKKEVARVQ
jgi:tetratricopeptide (TPR) repeat protein